MPERYGVPERMRIVSISGGPHGLRGGGTAASHRELLLRIAQLATEEQAQMILARLGTLGLSHTRGTT